MSAPLIGDIMNPNLPSTNKEKYLFAMMGLIIIIITLFSKPMLQRLQSESVQINTKLKYVSLHQLSRLWMY